FNKFPLPNLLARLSKQVDGAYPLTLLLLIFDGMDEVDTNVLIAFEREFVAPLFNNTRIRLLSSRRVDSISQRWRDFSTKKQNKSHPLNSLIRTSRKNYIFPHRKSLATYL